MTTEDLLIAAHDADLWYVSDSTKGIRREPTDDGFVYIGPDGSVIDDPDVLARIKSLVIPPAWRDVWICPYRNGHVQATGRDARGRKQYRYHKRWQEVRDQCKYDKLAQFGEALPLIRERVERDLSRQDLSKRKVLAAVVRLLELSLARVGNREYTRENRTFGLTTLRRHHVQVSGAKLRFEFVGKRGVKHSVGVQDRRLANVVRRLQDIPGQELFHYCDEEGDLHAIESGDVNEYLREITGQDFTAKDFRTFAGTVLTAEALWEAGPPGSKTEAKRKAVQAVDRVAERLGNTRAVARKAYVHPDLLDAYLEGTFPPEPPSENGTNGATASKHELGPREAAVLRFLQERAGHESPMGAAA